MTCPDKICEIKYLSMPGQNDCRSLDFSRCDICKMDIKDCPWIIVDAESYCPQITCTPRSGPANKLMAPMLGGYGNTFFNFFPNKSKKILLFFLVLSSILAVVIGILVFKNKQLRRNGPNNHFPMK